MHGEPADDDGPGALEEAVRAPLPHEPGSSAPRDARRSGAGTAEQAAPGDQTPYARHRGERGERGVSAAASPR
ncbi:Uncharacterised protein [Mycobacterium tuberculosis]|nr:Uncharacterised protein [Mycobacterium tuberculosis]